MTLTADPGAGPFTLGSGDCRNVLLDACGQCGGRLAQTPEPWCPTPGRHGIPITAGTTPGCGPHCPGPEGDLKGESHCNCKQCHGGN